MAKDEEEVVEPAGSETPGETPAPEVETAPVETPSEAPQDAGGAADVPEANPNDTPAPNAEESRTGFAEKGLHPGDECVCPDGRKGTVHSFDAGLICIPNHDQG
jgi:hypothetical protein